MMDRFSGYNQIAVHLDEREKISFSTQWGTFMYNKMPFGLINVGATFQRAMEKINSIVLFIEDMTVFLKSDDERLKHLERTFLKCRNFGIYLTLRNISSP